MGLNLNYNIINMKKAKKSMIILLISIFLSGLALAFWGCNQEIALASPMDLGEQEGFKDDEIPRGAFDQSSDPKDVRMIIAEIVRASLGFLGIIFLVLVIWSGFEWMTASGNEERVGQAKKRLKNSAIGLVIILAAYGITHFLITEVIDATRHPWDF